METFFERLHFLINEEAGGKHTVFAKRACIPVSTFQSYLSDRIPIAEHLIRISETFKISIDWILTGKGDPYIKEGIGDDDQVGISDPVTPYTSSNIIELQHEEVIKGFKDKELARDANVDLRDIENINGVNFRETCSYIKGVANTLRSIRGRGYNTDCRKSERRQADDPDRIPETGDRRVEKDRRKVAGN